MAEIAAVLGSRDKPAPTVVEGYSIDSRSLKRGELFFAIKGPRFDGHDFVDQAIGAGAVGAVVREGFEPASPGQSRAMIHVSDTTHALQQLARAVRAKWVGRVVGITGSTGKTTVKEMIATILGRRFRVLKTAGNLNNQFGLPLTLLRLAPETEVAVLEMGMSGPGEIALLADIARPEIGVVTNVAAVHLEFFDSVDSIARAKRELIEHLDTPAVAILNNDDERVRRFAQGFGGQVVTYGFSEGSDYRALGVRAAPIPGRDHPAIDFEVESPKFSGWLSIPLAGRHNVENALAAVATAGLFEIAPGDIRAALASLRLPEQRTEVLRLPGSVTIINDSYNSNPRAMERMIETLASWPDARRRIVLAGEMLELGASSPDWHRHIGGESVRAGIDWLIGVQGDAKYFLEGAEREGLPAECAAFFANAKEAGQFCRTLMRAGDVILVKGSRAVRLEEAIGEMKREHAAV